MQHHPESESEDPSFDEVYAYLRRRAKYLLYGQAPQTLTPTHVVHEALAQLPVGVLATHNMLLLRAVAARKLWYVLVDHARSRKHLRRDAGRRAEITVGALGSKPIDVEVLIDVDGVLKELDRAVPKGRECFQLKACAGMTTAEIATVLRIGPGESERLWRQSRAFVNEFLLREGYGNE